MSGYSDEIRGGDSGPSKVHKSPYIRQLNRALDMASDPFFESDHKMTPGEQYNMAWRECTHDDLVPSEKDLVRLHVGTHWLDVHPERVKRCDDRSYRRAILLDPRFAGKPAPLRFKCDDDLKKLIEATKAACAEFETAAIAREIAGMGMKKTVVRPDDVEKVVTEEETEETPF